MERERRRRGTLPASYTVEMTLLMTLILPMLVLILMLGFYLHDKACLQGAACETAAMGSNLVTYDTQASEISALGSSLMKHRAMWAGNAKGSVSANKKKASAVYTASFQWPGITSALWSGKNGTIQGSWSRTIHQGASLIRTVRGVEYVVDVARDG